MQTFDLFSDSFVREHSRYSDFLAFVMNYNSLSVVSGFNYLVVSSPFPKSSSDEVIVESCDCVALSGLFTALSSCYFVLPEFRNRNSILVRIWND